MARDVRELILARLSTILETLVGEVVGTSPHQQTITTTWRDRADVDPAECATLILLDGDSEKVTTTRGHTGLNPCIMALKPQIWIKLKDSDDVSNPGIGQALSAIRMLVLVAIATDQTLAGLLGENGGIEYLSEATDMGLGRELLGNMAINLSLSYFFDPRDLT